MSDLEKLQILGSGNGGTVYRVRHKQSSRIYALKVIRGGATDQVRQELEILRRINSPNTVRCHAIFEEAFGDISILMEYVEAGSMDVLVKKVGSFSETIVANIAYQSLKGLEHLHSKKIVHRDIKPSNLLVTREMEVKIADFGVSKIITGSSESACNDYVGTCAYMSPEKFDSDDQEDCNVFVGDVWSLGLTLMELYIGHYPYVKPGQKEDNTALTWEICFEEPPCMPEEASDDFKDFIECCLQKDWTKRWTVEKLLSHPFIVGARQKEIGLGSGIVVGTKQVNSVIRDLGFIRKKVRV